MANLGRVVEVRVGQAGTSGLLYTDLRVSFRVEQSSGGAPNKAEIRLYNAASHVLRALDGPVPTATLTAGYRDSLQDGGAYTPPRVLIAGDVIAYTTERAGPDRVTTLQVMDGGRIWQQAQIRYSYAAPVRLSDVLRRAAQEQGLTLGYVELAPDLELPNGGHFEGAFRTVLDRIARAGNAEWTIDGGVLHVVPIGTARPAQGPFFSEAQGTAFSIAKGEHGQVIVTAPLDGAIRPGIPFFVLADPPKPAGEFVARQVRHEGDSGFDLTFQTEIIGAPYRRSAA